MLLWDGCIIPSIMRWDGADNVVVMVVVVVVRAEEARVCNTRFSTTRTTQ
jgi:hypothetical protein